MIETDRLFYTVPELQKVVPLGRNTLYRWIQETDFPKITVNRRILIPVEGLNDYFSKKLGCKIKF